jgi:Uma2 family endonuclease
MTVLHLPPVEGRWTLTDLDKLPTDLRYEVHDGRLVIMSPARLWHQEIESRIRNLLVRAGRHAFTKVGVKRNDTDGRVPEVGVFYDEPADPEAAWHDPALLALVIEVWSRSSDAKDHNPQWYADRGIPEYWLATPIKGEKWGALIAMYELDRPVYRKIREATLAELEEHGRHEGPPTLVPPTVGFRP